MATTQYIGARYVPKFADPLEWNKALSYEPLTIVTYLGNSFTSKQAVPAGTDIGNTAYWANTGNYNAQVESYREEVEELSKKVNIVFPTVLDMQQNGEIPINSYVKCLGFSSQGVSSYFYIRNKTSNDTISTVNKISSTGVIALSENVVAQFLPINNYITTSQWGLISNTECRTEFIDLMTFCSSLQKEIYVDDYNYAISSTILLNAEFVKIKGNISWNVEPAIQKFNFVYTNSNGDLFQLPWEYGYCEISNISITGTPITGTYVGNGIHILSPRNIVTNCYIKNFDSGIILDNTSGKWAGENVIKECYMEYNNTAIRTQFTGQGASTDNYIIGNITAYNQYGIYARHIDGYIISENHFYDTTGDIYVTQARTSNITNNYFDCSNHEAVYLSVDNAINLNDNIFLVTSSSTNIACVRLNTYGLIDKPVINFCNNIMGSSGNEITGVYFVNLTGSGGANGPYITAKNNKTQGDIQNLLLPGITHYEKLDIDVPIKLANSAIVLAENVSNYGNPYIVYDENKIILHVILQADASLESGATIVTLPQGMGTYFNNAYFVPITSGNGTVNLSINAQGIVTTTNIVAASTRFILEGTFYLNK